MNQLKKFGAATTALVLSIGMAPTMLLAQSVYDDLTDAVDWTAVGAALILVGVAVIGVIVIMKGISFVVRAVRRA